MVTQGAIRKIFELGLKRGLSFEERMGIVLTNQLNLLAIIATFLYLIAIFYAGHWRLAVFASVGLGGYFITFWLNARFYHTFARFATLLTANVEIVIFASLMGRDVGVQWALLPILLGAIIAFNAGNRLHLLMGAMIPVFSFSLLELIDYQVIIPAFAFSFGEFEKQLIYYINAVVVSGLSVSILLYHFRVTKDQSQKLKANEASLLQSSKLARIGFSEVNPKENTAKWHPGLKEIMGVPMDYHPTKESFLKIVHPDYREKFWAAWTDAFANKDEFNFEYKLIRPIDGREIYIHSLGKIIRDKDGNPERMHAVLQDVTSEREKEAAIHETAQKAEAANLAKSRFLSNISHEVRTPLHGILGFAHLLKKTPLDPTQEKYISLMEYSGDMLLALIDDMLEVTRIEQGKIEIKNEAFDLQKLVESSLAPYRLQAQEKGLEFYIQGLLVENPMVFGDPLRIKQILLNLVSNAIKYTAKGKVMVNVTCLSPERDGMPLSLVMTVTDTGAGIPLDAQEKIFDTFTQLRTDLPESQYGLGLGLSIVSNLIELMQGKIKIKSPFFDEPQAPGSQFEVQIPIFAATREEIAQTTNDIDLSHHLDLKVLVAEDNEINQILIRNILEQAGYQVSMAINGEQAVQLALNGSYDLILMDVQMPVMGGYEATSIIRKKNPDIPIFALSANAYEVDKQESLAAGMNAHLSKPLKLDELALHISAHFSQFPQEKL